MAKDLLEKGVKEQEKELFLDKTFSDLMETELKKKVFVNVPINPDPPTGFQLPKNEFLSEIFAFS